MKAKRIIAFLLCAVVLLGFSACADKDNRSDDVVVLFTADVHNAIDTNMGYAGLSAYKKDMEEQYRYVVLADCGDFSQGGYESTVSKGEYMVDLMNAVGYDFAIFGNHEFDFGAEQLKKNVQKLNAHVLACNVTYTGSGENWIKEYSKPYEICTYGKTKVAFIGISTPWTIGSSTPTNFLEDGGFVYDFGGNNGGESFYNNVQKYVDECREQDVDFVVLLSHLGIDAHTDSPFTAPEVIENTCGIDVVIDSHSHYSASCWVRQNKNGEDVLLSSADTKLAKIGKLVLSPDGTASVGYVDSYEKKDDAITQKIADIRKLCEEQANVVVGHSDVDLSIYDGEGIRLVRSREVALGDFAADAYRYFGNADIGMINGGGVRDDLKKGDITYRDIISVNPFGNALCVVKVKGSEIADMVEYFYRYVQSEYKRDGRPYGDDGSFQQISGLSLTIDTSVPSSVEVTGTDDFIKVGETRRVKDIKVLKDGEYVPIDPDATYTLASTDYMIKNGGCGMLNFLADHELVAEDVMLDYQVLIGYMETLNGNLSQYMTPDNRIIVE